MNTKVTTVAKILHGLLMLLLLAAVFGFISFLNIYGFFLALVTALILVGVFKRARWGYFACAAWALACYQLAKQGYEFQSIKSWVMLAAFFVIPVAIFLHEILGKKTSKTTEKGSDEV